MESVRDFENYQLLAAGIGVAILGYNVITGNRPRWVHSLHEKYGPIVRITPKEVSVQDPDATDRIYAIKGEFLKASWYKQFIPNVQNVFSTTDVDYHRRHRRLLASEISESGLAPHRATVDSKIRLAIERMAEEMEERGATDVFRWFLYMATDIIGELSFGSSFRMLETKEENQYIRDLKAIGIAGGIRVTFPLLMQINNYIPIPVLSLGMRIRERLCEYASQSLQRHYDEVLEQGSDAKPTLLSKLYRASENDPDTLPFAELREDAMSYIAAGSDTTTNTMTYLVWTVCRRPDVKAKLVAELRALPPDFSDHEHLRHLPYLDHVITETLRLYSAAPSGLPRVVPQGGAVLAGRFVPGGYTVSAQAYSMHRNPRVYPAPLEFKPERWEKPTRAMKAAFVPFGGGSRICIGLHLAKMELRLATARFFTRFPNSEVSRLEGFTDDDMQEKMFFLTAPKGQRCLIDAK
ncbi:putative cytochrome P450 [Hypoxylon fragiforme]|uniref:putative cytochrome P450 n=1 Tax=Hypoxylon fragiforme TaxID=63214 RepID=UPI0020C6C53E|nr:putative cytochrome P450 [Hypoxylon fragiforme]KAI2610810.1 putative cytochrome P450 [Hypoxylon fragiforme]